MTTITGLLDDGKSGALAGAAAKIAKAGGDYRAEWSAKADRGTRLHAHCQAWLEGEWVEALPDEQKYLDSLERFFHDHDPDAVAVERVVLSERGYGGRFDFIALIAGVSTLVDVKTGKPYPLEHTLQLSAYRYADGMAKYSGGDLIGSEDLPPIHRAACLYLSEDAYHFVEYPAHRKAFTLFCQLLKVHQELKTMKEELKPSGAVRY